MAAILKVFDWQRLRPPTATASAPHCATVRQSDQDGLPARSRQHGPQTHQPGLPCRFERQGLQLAFAAAFHRSVVEPARAGPGRNTAPAKPVRCFAECWPGSAAAVPEPAGHHAQSGRPEAGVFQHGVFPA